jgi:hypothetical protein
LNPRNDFGTKESILPADAMRREPLLSDVATDDGGMHLEKLRDLSAGHDLGG